jgi:hypothetical protein
MIEQCSQKKNCQKTERKYTKNFSLEIFQSHCTILFAPGYYDHVVRRRHTRQISCSLQAILWKATTFLRVRGKIELIALLLAGNLMLIARGKQDVLQLIRAHGARRQGIAGVALPL